MNIRYLAIFATGMALAGNTLADGGEALAIKHNCMSCHKVSGPSMGPSYRDVAARYKGARDAQSMLARKVRNGGSGAWGKMPMPATANSVTDSDIGDIVRWILSVQ